MLFHDQHDESRVIISIILTFNSEISIEKVIDSCIHFSKRVVVVDSYSTDRTIAIAESLGCEVVQHPFGNYYVQRNWAQEYVKANADDWLLHLDSDELVDDNLRASITEAVAKNDTTVDGYLVRRLSYFLGKPIRYGQINPSWHLRLFKAGKGFCEHRLYDQHYVVPGKTRRLNGLLLDLQMVSVESWIASHNRWSTAEAEEAAAIRTNVASTDNQLKASLTGDLRMKKRWLKTYIWYRSPLFSRAFLFFFWSYFIRLGFLDGVHGLIYHVLQSFWFRFVVDAKIYEKNLGTAQSTPVADVASTGQMTNFR
jgi:glycosyltransferase involved in cell wall biosynthesis